MINIDDIIKQLPSFKKEQLTKIQTRISFLLSDDKKSSRTDEELFYFILSTQLGKKTKKKSPPYILFTKQPIYKKFKGILPDVNDYMKTVFKDQSLNRAIRQKFYMIGTKLVIEDLSGSPIPVNMTTVINTFSNLPALLDRAFPGYVGAGLLPMIIKAKYMNKKEQVVGEDVTR